MDLIERFKEKAKTKPGLVVLPEGDDERIQKAAVSLVRQGVARVVLVGPEAGVREAARRHGVELRGIAVADPAISPDRERYLELYCRQREGVTRGMAQRLLAKKLLFGAMMVAAGDADAMVAGAANPTASVIQAAGLAIGYEEGISTPSSFFIMVLPAAAGKEPRILVYADAGVNIDPTAEQLAEIAVTTGRSARRLLGIEPCVALLSFSTRGSASHPFVDKVVEAVKKAREKAPDMLIDGELQADAALVPEVAKRKVKESAVAGKANVLIFPELNSGNIAYKITQYLAGAEAYGPILQGFRRPVSDLSRGASPEDIVGVAAITLIQGMK